MMFVCYFIATVCFSSSLVAAMSSSAAFSSALEALNMVDVHSFISFVVSLPKEVAQFLQAVLDGFRLSISESPKPLPVLRIDCASVANYSTSDEICTYIKAPVHSVVSAFATASPSKLFHHSSSEKIAIVSTSSELNDPSLGHCQDMIMMLFIVAACLCLIRIYGYLRRIASCAFRRWQRANVSSLLIMPAKLCSASTELASRDEIACAFAELRKSKRQALLSAERSCYPLSEFKASSFDTPAQHHGSQMLLDFWASYSADESILNAFFLETVKFVNGKVDVDPQRLGSISSDTSNSSLEQTTPEEEVANPVLHTRELLVSLKIDLDLAATKLEEMRREPMTGIPTNPKVITKEAAERIQSYIHCVDEFERSLTQSQTLMSWVHNSMEYVRKTEAACGFQNRKAPQLQKRINACLELSQTKFGFDEKKFLDWMRDAHALSRCFDPGSSPKIQQKQIKEAYHELRFFLLRKGTMLSSLLDECLNTVRECEELRKDVAEFMLRF